MERTLAVPVHVSLSPSLRVLSVARPRGALGLPHPTTAPSSSSLLAPCDVPPPASSDAAMLLITIANAVSW